MTDQAKLIRKMARLIISEGATSLRGWSENETDERKNAIYTAEQALLRGLGTEDAELGKAFALKERNVNGRVDQRLYRLDPALDGYEFVVVSASQITTPVETYIFGADESGEILSWSELQGSYRGGLSHTEALLNAGYEIEETEEVVAP